MAPDLIDQDKNLHAVCRGVSSNHIGCGDTSTALTKCMLGATSRNKVAAASMQRVSVSIRAILGEHWCVRHRNDRSGRPGNLPSADRKMLLLKIYRGI